MPGKNRNYEPKVLTPTEPISGNTGKVLGTPSAEEATRSLMAEDKKRKEEAGLSLTEKRLLKKERDRQEYRKENRAGYDIGADLKEKIAELANSYGISNSQLAAWILWGGVKELERTNGEVLSNYKKPIVSLKFDWGLDLEKRKNE